MFEAHPERAGVVSMRVSAAERRELDRLARARRVTISELMREGVAHIRRFQAAACAARETQQGSGAANTFPIDSVRIDATGMIGPAERGPRMRMVVNEGMATETSFETNDLPSMFLAALLHECRRAMDWRTHQESCRQALAAPRCPACGLGPAAAEYAPPLLRDGRVL